MFIGISKLSFLIFSVASGPCSPWLASGMFLDAGQFPYAFKLC